MKSVLISINPKWVAKIASGEKKVEVRKSYPHCELPFKCYIYCTDDPKCLLLKDKRDGKLKIGHNGNFYHHRLKMGWNCKVVGEFVCDKIYLMQALLYDGGNAMLDHPPRKIIEPFSSEGNAILLKTALSCEEIFDYFGGDRKFGYGWHISDLKIYDEPKELSEFKNLKGEPITRAFQSWGYINA